MQLLLLIQPFYGPLSGTTRVSRYQKIHSPTHLSWSSSNLCQLLPSTTIRNIVPVQFSCLKVFAQPLSMSSLVYLLVWSPPPHTPYISSPNQCLLFATHAHTNATCFCCKNKILCKLCLFYIFVGRMYSVHMLVFRLPGWFCVFFSPHRWDLLHQWG